MRTATLAIACASLLIVTTAIQAGPPGNPRGIPFGRTDNDIDLPALGPPDWTPGPPDWTPGPPDWTPPGNEPPAFVNPEPSSIALGLVGGLTLAAGAWRRRRARAEH